MAIKWMAPESIETLTFSPRSDVWSFGILVWEIYSNAAEPWGHCSNVEARDKVRMLEEEMREQVLAGEKMDFPEGADPEVARLVRRHCWVKEPRLRVTMQDVSLGCQEERTVRARDVSHHAHLAGAGGPHGVGNDDGRHGIVAVPRLQSLQGEDRQEAPQRPKEEGLQKEAQQIKSSIEIQSGTANFSLHPLIRKTKHYFITGTKHEQNNFRLTR